jgi:site-specific DNA-methyltransferase (adenine-specific)
MDRIPDGSVDMILSDLPYGTTRNKWDSVIPLGSLWEQYQRIIKPHGSVLLTAQMPFSASLVLSNWDYFRYEWIWDKVNRKTGFLNVNRQPLRVTESVLVFYSKQPVFNPQMALGEPYRATSKGAKTSNYGPQKDGVTTLNNGEYYPTNLISIAADERGLHGRIHPTQKPVALFEYLIRTYTNPGETVLDNAIGSGTTAIACINTDRHYIGFEKDPEYFSVAQRRIDQHKPQLQLAI